MDWQEIRTEYEQTDISLLDLAEKHGIKYPTIKSRKQRQGWVKDASNGKKDASHEKDASKGRRGPPKGNRNAAGHGAPKGNKNAIGNSGGPGGPERNDKAVTHGFFRKYLPDDALEIMEAIETRSPLDMLLDNIMIQYAAIIRAQRIMYVEGKDEMIKELKKQKFEVHSTGEGKNTELHQIATEEEFEFQFAWDRQATFLTAQSRAMTTLQGLIRQAEEMSRQENADEEQRLRIDKLKGEVDKMNKDTNPEVVVFKDDLHE
ncbi:phage terminase small subunit [Paenibacillus sp. GbtcB18]|uniref:phage terminase small subunit n=1 Tax=Paenibacillus sp. GbtcB18 TaxID=2824763 RepID=UPI001C307E36|nr:phage terminase small subunit [Paenibacillus sp. GbtcB18]